MTPAPGAEAKKNLVKPAAYRDSPAFDYRSDTLGFTPYVEAVRDFLLHPATETPLCMSVEGEWGSGKSSFLRQLRFALKCAGAKTVFFNAWRHNNDESIWASFALEFVRELRQGSNVVSRVRQTTRLAFERVDWNVAAGPLVSFAWRLALLVLLFFVSFRVLFTGDAHSVAATLTSATADRLSVVELLVKGGGIAGYVVLALIVLKQLKELVGNPFETKLLQYIEDPGYRSRVSFAEKFHADFSKIVRSFAADSKVFVFVDDLDRCDVTATAELMQAINLIASSDDRGPVFVIAMDREIVAASLAARYEKLLPYLTVADDDTQRQDVAEKQDAAPKQDDAQQQDDAQKQSLVIQRGLDYGSAFMEKFIQLPFRVPKATMEGLWEYSAPDPADVKPLKEPVFSNVETDSDRVRTIVEAVAFVFNHNPRRIKQFINLFRLNVHIGARTRTLDVDTVYLADGAMPTLTQLTVEKLGKFLALTLRWPRFVEYLSADRSLLAELQKRALDPGHQIVVDAHHWSENVTLMRLLATMETDTFSDTVFSPEQRACIFSLEAIDADILLDVAPTAGSVKVDPKPPQLHIESDLFIDAFAAAGVPALLQSTHGLKKSNLELVVPAVSGGLAHFVYDRDPPKDRWRAHRLIAASESFEAASLIQSTYDDGNLELIARAVRDNRLSFFWRFAKSSAEWKGPYRLYDSTTIGRPVLFQSKEPPAANFEVVVESPTGLVLYQRDNSDVRRRWHGPTAAIMKSTSAEPVAVFDSDVPGAPSMTIVVLNGALLQLVDCLDGRWQQPRTIREIEGIAPAVLRRNGTEFDVFVVDQGKLAHVVYDSTTFESREEALIATELDDAETVCATRGADQRIDVIIRAKTRLLHFFLPQAGLPWQGSSDVIDDIRAAQAAVARRETGTNAMLHGDRFTATIDVRRDVACPTSILRRAIHVSLKTLEASSAKEPISVEDLMPVAADVRSGSLAGPVRVEVAQVTAYAATTSLVARLGTEAFVVFAGMITALEFDGTRSTLSAKGTYHVPLAPAAAATLSDTAGLTAAAHDGMDRFLDELWCLIHPIVKEQIESDQAYRQSRQGSNRPTP